MGAIAAFEWRFQRRGLLFWSLGSVFFLLSFLAMAVEQVQIGAASASMDLNASWVIVQTHLVLGILGMFAAIAFVAGAITRDYEAGTAELLFSTGVSARQFVLGRFLGGLLAALVVMVLAVLGTFLASLMPWLDPERVGPLRLDAYAFTLAVVTVPSTIIICGLFFVTAAWTRSVVWSYVAALALLVGYVTLGNLAEPEDLARYAWLDPFGIIPFGEQTRYWTTFERNDELPVLSGSLLWGRVLWCTIACAAVLITAFSYRLRLPQRGGRRPAAAAAPPVLTDGLRPVTPGPVSAFAALRSQLRMDVGALLRSTPFYVLLAFGLFNAVGGMLTGLSPLYGTPNYPLTRLLIDIISGTFSLVLLLVLVYYAGELVHREREARVKLLLDATPYPNGIMILSKLLALWFVLYAMLAVVGLTAVFVQLSKGYAHFEFDLYLKGLFGREAIDYLILAAIAVVIQCFASGKFLGMMATLAFFIFTAFLPELGVEHHLATFTTPAAPYSDLNGFGHFATPLLAYSAYWLLICGLLILVAHLFYERGIAAPFGDRRRQAALRIRSSGVRLGATTGLALTALLGGWIYYNTNILNEFTSSDKQERLQADYEKDYGGDRKPNPVSFRTLSLDVDLYPEQRRLAVTGRGELINLSDEPITELLLNVDTRFEYAQLTLAGAELAEDDALLGVRRYRFADPWLPGEQRLAEWAFDWRNPGFRDSGSSVRLVANGTFIDSQQLLPLPGYQSDRELADNNVRRRYDLPPVQRLPPLDDPLWRKAGAFGVRGRAAFDVRITTAADQIAVAPGYLVSDTITEPGRRRFEYRMDKPIWPFVSISSARYAVAERDSDGLKLQVFYHPDHDANIDVMLDGAADSLAYFSAAFGPYQHRQFRILEFPGYRSFAQSFPNTIPYSEDIGFVADLRDPADIDYVYYVTAHEAAHQWWAHQVAPAYTQGSTFIIESLAQYSALMVMEQRYGADKMRRFLKYELDRYLRGRGGEAIEELPLNRVENQAYIHYQKGGIALYDLKMLIGEAALNRALRGFVSAFGSKDGVFPTSTDLIAALRAEAPAEAQDRITDLFEKITIYDLKLADVALTPTAAGYEVTLDIEAHKFYADGEGRETEAPLAEVITLGLFPEPSQARSAELHRNDLPEPLLLTEQLIRSGRQTVTLTVAERPARAGVDPYVYRIDRNPDDNLKRVP